MAFNLYFAGWGSKDADEYLRYKHAHRLLSWVNERRVIDWWKNDNLADKLFIDSGAFSVAHSGFDIDIDDYIKFIESNNDIPNWAELDIIPYPILNSTTAKQSSVKSWENYVYMRERVIETNILPLYHFGEPREGLYRILNTEINGELAPYIGIGGRHGVSTDEQIRYFNEVFTIIQSSNNPNVRVHAFGITVPKILESFPFYSADSTTWLQAAINGYILTEDLQTLMISDGTKSNKSNIQTMPREVLESILPTVEKHNYKYEELCRDYKVRLRYNIDIMLTWEKQYIYKGPRTFKSQKLF